MADDDQVQEIMSRWRTGYVARASVLETELAALFQEALLKEAPGDMTKHGEVSSSLTYLSSRATKRRDQLVIFLYSGNFDPEVARELVNPDQPYRRGDPTPREIFEHKVSRLDTVFEPFVLMTDTFAKHYVAALMQGRRGSDLPLIWDVPTPDESETGYSSHAMWWTNFQYLCEISSAIFAYGGFTREFRDELTYIIGKPHLKRRLLWLDQDLQMYFADDDTVTWPADKVADALAEARRRSAA